MLTDIFEHHAEINWYFSTVFPLNLCKEYLNMATSEHQPFSRERTKYFHIFKNKIGECLGNVRGIIWRMSGELSGEYPGGNDLGKCPWKMSCGKMSGELSEECLGNYLGNIQGKWLGEMPIENVLGENVRGIIWRMSGELSGEYLAEMTWGNVHGKCPGGKCPGIIWRMSGELSGEYPAEMTWGNVHRKCPGGKCPGNYLKNVSGIIWGISRGNDLGKCPWRMSWGKIIWVNIQGNVPILIQDYTSLRIAR